MLMIITIIENMKNKILIYIAVVLLITINSNAQATKNKIGDKIYGDFNGDGNFEYAFRVLTKKGHGNPVENGIPDEYQIQFSDKNINPIKVDCCWFKLINEGDLNKDVTDEITIVQAPENGCDGRVRTFTIKAGKSYNLFNEFTIFWCGDAFKNEELQKLVFNENNVIYYYEDDPDGEKGLIKHKALEMKPVALDISKKNATVQNNNFEKGKSIDNSQINNLTDLLEISKLSLLGLTKKLQYTWEIKQPISDNSEKEYLKETYTFAYTKKNENEHSQLLRRNIQAYYSSGKRIELTNFITNDMVLLSRIIKNLPYQGFELKGKLKNQTMYEDGNRLITIQIGSSEGMNLPNGCYSITVVN